MKSQKYLFLRSALFLIITFFVTKHSLAQQQAHAATSRPKQLGGEKKPITYSPEQLSKIVSYRQVYIKKILLDTSLSPQQKEAMIEKNRLQTEFAIRLMPEQQRLYYNRLADSAKSKSQEKVNRLIKNNIRMLKEKHPLKN